MYGAGEPLRITLKRHVVHVCIDYVLPDADQTVCILAEDHAEIATSAAWLIADPGIRCDVRETLLRGRKNFQTAGDAEVSQCGRIDSRKLHESCRALLLQGFCRCLGQGTEFLHMQRILRAVTLAPLCQM